MPAFSKILVPTDFSSGAELAIERALVLRQRFGATLLLFHAYQLPIVYSDMYTFSPELISLIERSAMESMASTKRSTEMRAATLQHASSLPPLQTKVVCGPAALAITDEAKAAGCDLIVMGTHGRTGLAHLFIGSVAERVVRTAPCDVLTIRARTT